MTIIVCIATAVTGPLLNAAEPEIAPQKQRLVLEIKQNITLDPKQVYGTMIVIASDIVFDGQGAWLIDSATGDPKGFKGTAIIASGVSNVTLKNINTKGWETGLKLNDATDCTIEGCDFSNNFHDPNFGWGENGRRGSNVLERVAKSTLRKNKANHVWDGCVLVDSDENILQENDFSHASNTCLKLWSAGRNIVRNNVLSHGIRISPGEVHARDSTKVLIESGSNDNQFIVNDCTHGGDGIFVRVPNGWCSTGNRSDEHRDFKQKPLVYRAKQGFAISRKPLKITIDSGSEVSKTPGERVLRQNNKSCRNRNPHQPKRQTWEMCSTDRSANCSFIESNS